MPGMNEWVNEQNEMQWGRKERVKQTNQITEFVYSLSTVSLSLPVLWLLRPTYDGGGLLPYICTTADTLKQMGPDCTRNAPVLATTIATTR